MSHSSASNSESRFLVADAKGSRDEQQDAGICLSSHDRGTALLVVSDGVGGNSGGRIASQQVAKTAREIWEEQNGELPDPRNDLQTLCRLAHEQINDEGAKHGISPRATIVALYLTSTHAYWIHSGDSRLYHFRAGKLVTRTKDHSVIEIMVKQGLVKEEEMGTHPDQGVLIQSLGGEDYKNPSSECIEITPEDAFVLCTDGFWERTKTEEMAQMLFGSKIEAVLLLEQAVKRAVKRNGPDGDNVTAAVALPVNETNFAAGDMGTGVRHRNPLRGIRLRTMFLGSALLLLAAVALVAYFNLGSLLGIGQQTQNTSIASPSGTPANRIPLPTIPEGAGKLPPATTEYIDLEQLKKIKSIPITDENEIRDKDLPGDRTIDPD